MGHGCRQRDWEDRDGRVARMERCVSEVGKEGEKREVCEESHYDDSWICASALLRRSRLRNTVVKRDEGLEGGCGSN